MWFQFQTGAIKSRLDLWTTTSANCFNSKLVRLKAPTAKGLRFSDVEFQFQTGAIKSANSGMPLCVIWRVSIPNWCD